MLIQQFLHFILKKKKKKETLCFVEFSYSFSSL